MSINAKRRLIDRIERVQHHAPMLRNRIVTLKDAWRVSSASIDNNNVTLVVVCAAATNVLCKTGYNGLYKHINDYVHKQSYVCIEYIYIYICMRESIGS